MSSAESAPQGGSYDVIRARLVSQAQALRAAAEALNEQRKAAFGGTELQVVGSVRVRTENNCVPRDIVPVGDELLFGYNVFVGLRTETKVEDVFSLQRLRPDGDGWAVEPAPHAGTFLAGAEFVRDFREIYKYYKDTKLAHVRRVGGKLLMAFQTGATLKDAKVLRFLLPPSGAPTYVDSRGERDDSYPPSHDFEWVRTTRDDQVSGRYPHVSILDRVFVETVGGDLTIKVENNTESGRGIYAEPVEDANQSLDDADISYSAVEGLILLRIKPFREEAYRYFVFNERTQEVTRIDAIGLSCVHLPEGHGLVFPGGYYLVSGETKSFDVDTAQLQLERVIRSPNGEDVLYVFRRPTDGSSILLAYNLIRKEVANPIRAHGASIFDDGTMVVFQATSEEATRVHPMQIWRTPFLSAERAAEQPRVAGFMGRIGNAELVRGISDALGLAKAAEAQRPTRRTWEELIAASTRALDAYHWLGEAAAQDLASKVRAVQATAELIVDEFEKAEAIRRRAEEALTEARAAQAALVGQLRPEDWVSVELYLSAMVGLRKQRGHLVSLRDVRGVDLAAVDALEAEAIAELARVSKACVGFLLDPRALAPLAKDLAELLGKIEAVDKSAQLAPLDQALTQVAEGLAVLTEVMGGLDVEDPTAKTRILEGVSEVYAQANRVRATLAAKKKSLALGEGRAEFAVQFRLFAQTVDAALGQASSPEQCDAQLSRVLVSLEEVEGRFSELDEFLGELATKREEVVEAFEARKQVLVDERQRRAQSLITAAERIVAGMVRRARSFGTLDELNAYFAADPMVAKLRQISVQLGELGDTVKADEVDGKLKSAKQDALRALRDKAELYADGGALIQLGRHRFSVNTQPFEVSVVPRGEGLALHVAGTDFYEPLEDAGLTAAKPYWGQQLPSETEEVYRGEYLAATLLFAAEASRGPHTLAALSRAAQSEAELLALVRAAAAERYDEGYERGIHDHDAARILERWLALRGSAGLLRYPPRARAAATLWWASREDGEAQARVVRQAQSLGRVRATFGATPALAALGAELGGQIGAALAAWGLPLAPSEAALAGEYAAEELSAPELRWVVSREAVALRDALLEGLGQGGDGRAAWLDDQRALAAAAVGARHAVVRAWLEAFVSSREDADRVRWASVVDEATALVLTEGRLTRAPSAALTRATVTGLLGQHPRIVDRTLPLVLDEVITRLRTFVDVRVPGFRAYRQQRAELVERERRRLRLGELEPKVLTSFVRNKLISEVYLPLIGDNLAKQLGAAGDKKRTDLMGLLLVVSPPGYGKTTLMEYVANRLGMIFMKVNGPALGHGVTSLDPAEAPNATARQEVEKINLGLELGNNVMLYLDDIQHTHPELLQKFISLCDAQRKIEGVWRGRTRTYDLRGKKFCVVMAGNPYTESGDRFRIPDMLANRADTYNLGEVLTGKDHLFALSYLENALTSSPVLAPLAARDPADLERFLRMAAGEAVPASELVHPYSAAEREEIVAVLVRLAKVQRTLLAVNRQYIASASQDDAYRNEPPFKLQGSYRNMNKLTEKVVAAMTDDELERLVDDHYRGESQTLTTGAEQNLLKLAELRGRMTAAERERWDEIRRGFKRVQVMGDQSEDPTVRAVAQLASVSAGVDGIRAALHEGRGVPASLETLGEVLARASAAQAEAVRASVAQSAASRASDAEVAPAAQAVVASLREIAGALGQVRPLDLSTLSTSLAEVVAALRFAAVGRTEPTRPAQATDGAGATALLAQQHTMHEEVLQAIVRASRWEAEDMRAINRSLGVIAEILRASAEARGVALSPPSP
jgi:hypothetical protein